MTGRNWEVTPDSELAEGRSSLALLARHTRARFVLLDPTNGVRGLRDQLAELAQAVSADSVTLVDVGGDIIAQGDEPELLSPLADSMTLAALDGLPVTSRVVIAGAGLDCELAEDDVLATMHPSRQYAGRAARARHHALPRRPGPAPFRGNHALGRQRARHPGESRDP